MQITFAGTIIAQEPTENGTDAVTGFMPKRKTNVQWAEFLRATDATPIARFNRKRSLTGSIVYGAFSTLSLAAQKLLLNYDSLPDFGELKILVNGSTTLFSNAVLEDVTAVKRYGVTVAASLTFQVGPGVALSPSGTPLTTPDGDTLTTPGGDTMTTP